MRPDIIVPTGNSEPVTVLDAIEAGVTGLDGIGIHQLFALRDRPHHAGAYGDRLRHLSYFLTVKIREHFERGTVDLVPNDLDSIPALLRARTTDPLLIVSVSPPDRHGCFTAGAQ